MSPPRMKDDYAELDRIIIHSGVFTLVFVFILFLGFIPIEIYSRLVGRVFRPRPVHVIWILPSLVALAVISDSIADVICEYTKVDVALANVVFGLRISGFLVILLYLTFNPQPVQELQELFQTISNIVVKCIR